MVPDDTADLDQLIDEFCEASNQKVLTTYNKNITCIIFDVENLLNDSYFSDKHRNACIVTRPVTYLLKDLLKGGAAVNFKEQESLMK